MKTKKIILTTTALLGAGALAYSAVKVAQEQKKTQQREKIIQKVRDFFSTIGEIATVYVLLHQSDENKLVGGVVFVDNRHFTFTYENGQLSYIEEKI